MGGLQSGEVGPQPMIQGGSWQTTTTRTIFYIIQMHNEFTSIVSKNPCTKNTDRECSYTADDKHVR